MTDEPVELDEHRGMAAQKATELRRHRLLQFQNDQEELRVREEELERFLAAAPAVDWAEAVAKAQYLIRLFAATPEAQDPQRQRLVAVTLEDLARLSNRQEVTP